MAFFLKQKILAEWYQKHLGINFGGETYFGFKWINHNNPGVPGLTAFSFFDENTEYFQPSEKPYMINFHVKNLVELLNGFKKENVTITGEIQQFEYGKFGWIMDPEENKIELWEPVDDKI